jgi:hypothetical protein
MAIAVRIEASGQVKELRQGDDESDEAFRKRVDVVIALLQEKPHATTARKPREPAALGVIRAAIRSKRR